MALSITISNCIHTDGPALARNNMSAFWTNQNWKIVWTVSLPELISQASLRIPRMVLKDREKTRHLKAVDPSTGEVIGYARWVLPPRVADLAVWPEAVTPGVASEEERRQIEQTAESAVWKPRSDTDVLDVPLKAKKEEILSAGEYMELELLAVRPDYMRKGVATALVEAGTRAAEAMGVDVFVMAFSMGKGVYQKLGYRVVAEIIQDDSKFGGPGEFGAWFMVKEFSKGDDAE